MILGMQNMLMAHKGKHTARNHSCGRSEALPKPQRKTDLRPWQASLPKSHLFSELTIHESWNLRKAWLQIFRPELLNYSCACQRPNSSASKGPRPNSSEADISRSRSDKIIGQGRLKGHLMYRVHEVHNVLRCTD